MTDAETMEQVRQQLSSRAELFEDPRTYLDGVQDALDCIQDLEADAHLSAASVRDSIHLIESEEGRSRPAGTVG